MATFTELDQKLGQLRAAIDRADATPMGEIGKLLDSMALQADEAISLAERLRQSHEMETEHV